MIDIAPQHVPRVYQGLVASLGAKNSICKSPKMVNVCAEAGSQLLTLDRRDARRGSIDGSATLRKPAASDGSLV